MNWDIIQGEWKKWKGAAQEKWGELTGDDVDRIAGSREELEGKIQSTYGRSKEEARREVDEWLASL